MLDLLLAGGTVVTCDTKKTILSNALIGVSDGKITLLKSNSKSQIELPEARRILRLDNEIVIPGLINTHCHAADSLFRGLVENLSLEEWLQKVWKVEKAILTPETTLLGSYLGLAENLLAGVTTVVDMFWYPFETAKASIDLGMRLSTGGIFIDFPGVGDRTHDDFLIEAEDFCSTHKNSKMVYPAVMPHGTYTVSPDHLRDAKKIAAKYDAIFSIHAAETQFEQADIKKRYGVSVIKHLSKLGLLDKRSILAHCVHLDDAERDLIKRKNANVALNSLSNLKLGSGIASIPDFLDRNINLTIGTDGAISGNDLDMWLSMRLAATLPKGFHMKPDIVTASEVVDMATINGAKALGKEGEIGSIEIGKQADLAIISTNSINCFPLFDPVTHLVYSSSKSDVRHVFIGGQQCVENGKLIKFDIDSILLEVRNLEKKIKSSLDQ